MSAPRDWRELSHEELYAAVQGGSGPGVSMAAEVLWGQLAEIVDVAEKRMHDAVTRSADGWEGGGGDAARAGLHTLNSWALGAASDARSTLGSMAIQGDAAARLRDLMPPPDTERLAAARDAADVELFDEGVQQGLLAAEEESRSRDEIARSYMRQYFGVSYETQRTIDFWTTPPTVVVEAALPGAGTGPAGGAGGPESGSGPGVAGALSGVDGSGSGVGVPGGGGPVPASLPTLGAAPEAGANPGVPGAGGAGVPGGSGGAGSGAGPAGSGVTGSGVTGSGVTGSGVTGSGVAGGGAPGSAGVAGGAPGAGGVIVGGGGPAVAGVPARTTSRGGAPPIPAPGSTGPVLSREALPPGAGGRGPRSGPIGSGPSPGPRGLFPGAPIGGGPSPTWRDVVAGLRGGGGGGVADPPAGPRGGGGPRPEVVRAVATPPVAETGRGGTGHGIYPPMGGGAAGGQGESRRRAPYLVDDSGVFDVDVPYTDPVIGGVAFTGDETR